MYSIPVTLRPLKVLSDAIYNFYLLDFAPSDGCDFVWADQHKKSPALFGSHRPSTTITLSTSCILYVTSGTSGLHAASIKTITIQSFLTFIFPLLTVVRRERFELPT